jgi:hypothetical protein
MDFNTLEGNSIDNNLEILYSIAVDEAKLAKPFAIKSHYEVRGSALQQVDGKIFKAHGSPRNCEIGAADTLWEILPDGVLPNIEVLAFYNPNIAGEIARICGFCRGKLNIYVAFRDGKLEEVAAGEEGSTPFMAENAVVIGAGQQSAIVVPWKNYLAEPWKEAELDISFRKLKRAIPFSRAIYTEKQIVGAFIYTSMSSLDELAIGASLEYSSPEREVGPITAATYEFLRKKGKGEPEGFVFASFGMPEVNYSWRQMLSNRAFTLGVKEPTKFKVYRADLSANKVEVATLGELLPYAFRSAKHNMQSILR